LISRAAAIAWAPCPSRSLGGVRSGLTQLLCRYKRAARTVGYLIFRNYSGRTQSMCERMGTVPRLVNLHHHRRCALVLLGVLGIFAFVASAVSSQDDDYQQECFHGGRMLRSIARSTKTASAKRIGYDVHPLVLTAKQDFREPQTMALPHVIEAVWPRRPHLAFRSGRAPPVS